MYDIYKTVSNIESHINSSSNDKILEKSKLKAFAEDKIDVNQILKFDLGSVENIVRKEENASYQHFPILPQYFRKASFSRSLKVCIVW